MNDIMIDFSQGFNAFIESLEEKYVEMIITRRQATLLLKRMLSLKLPFAQLLYYTYYKRLHPEEIKDKLYISRATFYRKKSDAINALTHLCFPNL
jgi:DNA-directed RNA polymerase specialized sigma subunit